MSQVKSQSAIVAPVNVALVTTKQAAQILQLSERTVFNALKAGLLPSVKIGRSLRIRVADIDALIREAKTLPQPSVDEVTAFVDDLKAGNVDIDAEFATTLATVLSAYKQHLEGDHVDIKIYRDAALRLADDFTAKHGEKDAWTKDQMRVSRFLTAALNGLRMPSKEQSAA